MIGFVSENQVVGTLVVLLWESLILYAFSACWWLTPSVALSS